MLQKGVRQIGTKKQQQNDVQGPTLVPIHYVHDALARMVVHGVRPCPDPGWPMRDCLGVSYRLQGLGWPRFLRQARHATEW